MKYCVVGLYDLLSERQVLANENVEVLISNLCHETKLAYRRRVLSRGN